MLPCFVQSNSSTSFQPPLFECCMRSSLLPLSHARTLADPMRLSQNLLLKSSRHCTPTSNMHVTCCS